MTEAEIMRAQGLYLEGRTVAEIAKKMKLRDGAVSANIVTHRKRCPAPWSQRPGTCDCGTDRVFKEMDRRVREGLAPY